MIARILVFALLSSVALCDEITAQVAAPSGVLSVRILRGVDSSAMRIGQALPGTVVNSSNGSVPQGSGAAIQLAADPSGGFTLQLVRIGVGGQMFATTSSPAQLQNGSLAKGHTLSLVPNTIVSFTILQTAARGLARTAPPDVSARRNTAPVQPRHPANTARDIASALPGYPMLHASHDAEEGCWWAPFISSKWGFEAVVQQCEDPNRRIAVVESDSGLAFVLHPGEKPENFLEVRTKAADQPVEAAIKQQYIMKLKVPAARTNCKVKQDKQQGNAESYTIIATGPYSKLKKFQSEDDSAEEPCPGLMTNDAVTFQFIYLPAESKTNFFFSYTEDYGNYFDYASIRFPTQTQ